MPEHGSNGVRGDFRVVLDPKVGLLDAPAGKQLAVAPKGTVLKGFVEFVDGALWLRIDLAAGNPLRDKKGVDVVWTSVGDEKAGLTLEWIGPLNAEFQGQDVSVKWAQLFLQDSLHITYMVESNQGKGEWSTLWTGQSPDCYSLEKGSVRMACFWPFGCKRASIRVVAEVVSENQEGSQSPDLTLAPARLWSCELSLCSDPLEGRSLDLGVPHMRQTRSAWAIAKRKLLNAGGQDPELMALVEETGLEVERCMLIRANILKDALDYVPRKGPIVSEKKIVLTKGQRIQQHGPRFKQVLVMGLYHSCTNAVLKELERRFECEVTNDWHTRKIDAHWKHRVNCVRPDGLEKNQLVILMVKEPHFWLKSCSREVRNFFELHPVVMNPETGLREDGKPQNLQDLLGPIEHDCIMYPNAAALWSDYVRSYFDDEVYPPEHCVIVRCEDFLFRFHDVMDALRDFGLEEKQEAAERPDPLADRAKGHMECRTRDQALDFYAHAENMTSGFSSDELAVVARHLDAEALKRLHYHGRDPVSTWMT
eukprot:gnl/TRDRNA2_/TRDRNA2_29339_c0_seq1.p1 gnl/TRDRNA2_/TRDRNA2_29339_c0~~gnl/TRDRNA2_/TRDRNA2_29339_c0_seq1.p1  ORF type:complete len:560 (+),score=72.62 gnl/TRDRNA2_/TRDRNA2_29339_c0_seq1:75-1682(+)